MRGSSEDSFEASPARSGRSAALDLTGGTRNAGWDAFERFDADADTQETAAPKQAGGEEPSQQDPATVDQPNLRSASGSEEDPSSDDQRIAAAKQSGTPQPLAAEGEPAPADKAPADKAPADKAPADKALADTALADTAPADKAKPQEKRDPGAVKAGDRWISPQFMPTERKGDFARQNAPVNKAPSPEEALFQRTGKPMELTDKDGKKQSFKTPEEYKAWVKQNREKEGPPFDKYGDKLMPVSLALEGGGGKGKLYDPALRSMLEHGVVPAELTGTSAGSIAAGLLAAGANPKELDAFMRSPQIDNFLNFRGKERLLAYATGGVPGLVTDHLTRDKGGLASGKEAYDAFDQELRRLTGITDRPVTFADLKMPLNIVATKMADSGVNIGPGMKDRVFVFNQQNTPDTPVALAMRASMSLPGVFAPVQMTDPNTGRKVTLVDGGIMDNLPMGYGKNGLPQIGVSLHERGENNPRAPSNTQVPGALPRGDLGSNYFAARNLTNAAGDNSILPTNRFPGLMQQNGTETRDFQKRTNPGPGQFMLGLPTWELKNPGNELTTMGFKFEPKNQPILDQDYKVTNDFLRRTVDQLNNPQARYTNTPAFNPQRFIDLKNYQHTDGRTYDRMQWGGANTMRARQGNTWYEAKVDPRKMENLLIDNYAFQDGLAQLRHELNGVKFKRVK